MKWFILSSTIMMVCAILALVFSYWYVQHLLSLEASVVNEVIVEE